MLRLFLLCILLLCGAAGYAYYQLVARPLPFASDTIEFTVPAGSGLNEIARRVEVAGAGIPAWQLAWLGRALQRDTQIKAGSYAIRGGINAVDLLDVLTRGDVVLAKVTLIEGRRFSELRALLDAHPDLRHDTKGLSEREILRLLDIDAPSAEGQFLPETYLLDKGASDLSVLRQAHHGLQAALAQAWASRAPDSPLASPYELLTLASVIEKETGRAADRELIASVFANRLRIGMRLQSDPTVIYGLGEKFDGNLRRADLQADTPWNSYTRAGLPPTPISLVSPASLAAAARPAESKFLYFVARGDGSSAFSATLEAHNAAVARYQKGKG
jgi:UPF0755 protein